MLINVKTPTIVGILTFISMIKATSERLNARNFFICRYFSYYEQLRLRGMKKVLLPLGLIIIQEQKNISEINMADNRQIVLILEEKMIKNRKRRKITNV